MATNDSTIDRVLLWMVSGLAGADLETACVAKLEVDPLAAHHAAGSGAVAPLAVMLANRTYT